MEEEIKPKDPVTPSGVAEAEAETAIRTGEPPRWGKGTRSPEEGRFLEGPQTRASELRRLLRILGEFVRGFRRLHFLGPCVTVFGSARFPEDHRFYALGREMGRRLGAAGFTVMTGGGPGVMEAANRGAKDVGACSVGLNIVLPFEQKPNPYLDQWLEFRYFFVRKVMLVKYSYGFIAFPGGFGTLDEVFEAATLVQTGKIRDFPIVLVGHDFWDPLLDFARTQMLGHHTISAADIERFFVTDSPEAAVQHVLSEATGRFGLSYAPPRRHWWLGERRPPAPVPGS
jgi:uncharacterized protein (TIGR00730 family)